MNGTFQHNLDVKGRLFVPVKLRTELGEDFYVVKWMDGCLAVFSKKNWDTFTDKVKALPMAKSRNLQRMLFSSAESCSIDAQGRVLIPLKLREYASLEKETVIIGVGDHAEIWRADSWRDIEDSFSADDLAEAMDEIGI